MWFPRTLLPLAAALVCSAGASAQPIPPASGGEWTQVLACPFECKPDRKGKNDKNWSQLTTLTLANLDADGSLIVYVLYMDGNETPITRSRVDLSPLDVDEINLCRTLHAAALPVPKAGMVIPYVVTGNLSAFGWVKSLYGSFVRTEDEPHHGKITALARIPCKHIDELVTDPVALNQVASDAGLEFTPPVLVEDTADPDPD